MAHESLGITKIEGLPELLKKLQGLPAEIIRKTERSAVKKALRPTYDAVMSRVPVGETGNLAENIRIASKVVTANAGGAYMYGMVAAGAPHAHLVEYGHKMVTHAGVDTGKVVPPHPFMLPALLETSDEACRILADEIDKGVKKCEVPQ